MTVPGPTRGRAAAMTAVAPPVANPSSRGKEAGGVGGEQGGASIAAMRGMPATLTPA
jgi:hypothetical protein